MFADNPQTLAPDRLWGLLAVRSDFKPTQFHAGNVDAAGDHAVDSGWSGLMSAVGGGAAAADS